MNEEQQSSETPAGEQPPAEPETNTGQEPPATEEPAAETMPSATREPVSESAPPKKTLSRPKAPPRRQPTTRRPQRGPASIADYFTACPRCSFFLVGYRLIFQDFDQVASTASGDWLDLSWNLAVRNLVAKSYGYEMAEPIQILQGVCPACRRAFIFEAGDEEADGDRFSIQINPR
jgi:hypothetical protein